MCQASGLSPSALAHRAGVSPGTISRYIYDRNVRHKPSSRTLSKIERAATEALATYINRGAASYKEAYSDDYLGRLNDFAHGEAKKIAGAAATEIERQTLGLNPQDLSPESLKTWLVQMAELADTSPTGLAKLANVAPSTVNRFLANDKNEKSLSSNTLAKIMTAAQSALQARIQEGSVDPESLKQEVLSWAKVNKVMDTVPGAAKHSTDEDGNHVSWVIEGDFIDMKREIDRASMDTLLDEGSEKTQKLLYEDIEHGKLNPYQSMLLSITDRLPAGQKKKVLDYAFNLSQKLVFDELDAEARKFDE